MQNRPEPAGGVIFSGALLLLVGLFQAILGLVELFNQHIVAISGQGLVVWTYATWGWIHVVVGGLLVLVGLGVFATQGWARWAAIVLACLSALVQMAFFFAFPLWSLLVIALDVVIIWQLSAHWRSETAATH